MEIMAGQIAQLNEAMKEKHVLWQAENYKYNTYRREQKLIALHNYFLHINKYFRCLES